MDSEQWCGHQKRIRDTVRLRRRDADGSTRPATVANSQPSLASVIVVCFNAEEVLGRCLEQLLAQSYSDYEIIIVDDGSRDGTRRVAETVLGSASPSIVKSPVNRGAAHARNLGLHRARGEIIAFIDADGYASQDWLSEVVAAFELDDSIGAVASTVFYASNPLVINGAGGTINRQGWAADMSMNESYEHAELAVEALYPMGCGMAIRRSAIERVGPFDHHIVNYYDDVDYGIRLWRAGYRVAVAADAWIDHDYSRDGGTSQKRLLCERHRMRVVLKHMPVGSLGRWAAHEWRALKRAPWGRRRLKLKAVGWNARHMPSAFVTRWRARQALPVPDRLIDPSWGEAFPAGLPPLATPRLETATRAVQMTDRQSDGQLLYGWFPLERIGERSYRWAATRAAVLVRVDSPARRLRLVYAHVPVDTGGVDIHIRQVGSQDPLATVWGTRLAWQYIERSVENHPLELISGDYEVLFTARDGWSEPPREIRSLAFALTGMSLEPSFNLPSDDGLDMASPHVEEQLVSGWFELEQSAGRSYRWASGHAAAVVNIAQDASGAHVIYRLPPTVSDVTVAAHALGQQAPIWSHRIAWRDADWHEDDLALRLPAGDYLLTFDAEAPWSNPGRRDASLWAENRSLGVALSSLRFDGGPPGNGAPRAEHRE
jgi:GT2 family glycosyltransferase